MRLLLEKGKGQHRHQRAGKWSTSPKAVSVFESCFHKCLVTPVPPLLYMCCVRRFSFSNHSLAAEGYDFSLETVSLLKEQAEVDLVIFLIQRDGNGFFQGTIAFNGFQWFCRQWTITIECLSSY